jgi:PAS domain S-box-containing protein
MLSHLVATSPDLITLTDLATGRYVMVNQAFERVTGYRGAEVVGRTSVELGLWQHTDDRATFIDTLRETGTVRDVPVTFVTKSGQPVQMLVSGARFAMDRREYVVVNARDVTAAEHARLEREAILGNAAIGIAVTRDRRFVVANPYFEELYGWPPGQLIGQHGSVVWADDDDYRAIGVEYGPRLGRGSCTTSPSAASSRPRSRARATPPRPRAARRARSSPTRATSCARRCTACSASPTSRARPTSARSAAGSTSIRSARPRVR